MNTYLFDSPKSPPFDSPMNPNVTFLGMKTYRFDSPKRLPFDRPKNPNVRSFGMKTYLSTNLKDIPFDNPKSGQLLPSYSRAVGSATRPTPNPNGETTPERNPKV